MLGMTQLASGLDGFYLPDHVQGEYVAGAQRDIMVTRAFQSMLNDLDPHLRVFWVPEAATSFEHPGRWHIGRFGVRDELNAYWVVQTPEGTYCEPQQMHFDRLLQMDTFRDAKRAYQKLQQARTDRQLRRRKEFEARREAFRELLTERLDHIFDTRIAVTGGMKSRAIGASPLLDAKGRPMLLDADKPATEERAVDQGDLAAALELGREKVREKHLNEISIGTRPLTPQQVNRALLRTARAASRELHP